MSKSVRDYLRLRQAVSGPFRATRQATAKYWADGIQTAGKMNIQWQLLI
jgi:hypothetical protein